MLKIDINITNDKSLLNRFNNRDKVAFSEVYSGLYKELYYFANSLYKNTTVDSEDIIQDVFFNIWDDKKRKFNSISHLRAFLFVCIKNGYIRHCSHQKIVDKAHYNIIQDSEYLIYKAAEAEIFSSIPDILNMLPTECAKSFKLSLEGYDIKEIAEKLGKQPSTIYNQRKMSIAILNKKLNKDKVLMISQLLSLISWH